ncbi:MAG: EamA family transporter [Burkholderiales bacterium]|nr:EamA family transporter [Burkholderiales bacterium]
MTRPVDTPHAVGHALSHAFVPMAVLALIWGCNWPVLKLGVTEIPPLTFRAVTLPFAALGMLAVARASGESIAIPRDWWGRVAVLAFFNIAGWNGLVLFGVQLLPAGRSAIIAYTMPVWATLVALMVLHEPLGRRKAIGLVLGMIGMALLLGEDFALLRRSPFGAGMILGAAILWSIGTVLLRKWKPPIAQNALSGWMMLGGWLPLAVAAPFLDDAGVVARVANASHLAWLAIAYNIVLAGTLAHWAWFTLARTLPVAVSGLASLPVPVVGVFAGMIVLGERPGTAEWLALGFVVASLVAVLWPARTVPKPAPLTPAD